ncbi:AaceriAFR217Wp [[Ashbya] aceris (nom. inval.)]|nr:AaceriAFR217Wp [[Ashbya] aceris (nom. inval.)]
MEAGLATMNGKRGGATGSAQTQLRNQLLSEHVGDSDAAGAHRTDAGYGGRGASRTASLTSSVTTFFKGRRRGVEKDDDNDEEVILGDQDIGALSMNDLGSLRNNGGHKYGYGGGVDDMTVIPTLGMTGGGPMSNTDYRKRLTAQKKMAFNTMARQNRQPPMQGYGPPTVAGRAMSLQSYNRRPPFGPAPYGKLPQGPGMPQSPVPSQGPMPQGPISQQGPGVPPANGWGSPMTAPPAAANRFRGGPMPGPGSGPGPVGPRAMSLGGRGGPPKVGPPVTQPVAVGGYHGPPQRPMQPRMIGPMYGPAHQPQLAGPRSMSLQNHPRQAYSNLDALRHPRPPPAGAMPMEYANAAPQFGPEYGGRYNSTPDISFVSEQETLYETEGPESAYATGSDAGVGKMNVLKVSDSKKQDLQNYLEREQALLIEKEQSLKEKEEELKRLEQDLVEKREHQKTDGRTNAELEEEQRHESSASPLPSSSADDSVIDLKPSSLLIDSLRTLDTEDDFISSFPWMRDVPSADELEDTGSDTLESTEGSGNVASGANQKGESDSSESNVKDKNSLFYAVAREDTYHNEDVSGHEQSPRDSPRIPNSRPLEPEESPVQLPTQLHEQEWQPAQQTSRSQQQELPSTQEASRAQSPELAPTKQVAQRQFQELSPPRETYQSQPQELPHPEHAYDQRQYHQLGSQQQKASGVDNVPLDQHERYSQSQPKHVSESHPVQASSETTRADAPSSDPRLHSPRSPVPFNQGTSPNDSHKEKKGGFAKAKSLLRKISSRKNSITSRPGSPLSSRVGTAVSSPKLSRRQSISNSLRSLKSTDPDNTISSAKEPAGRNYADNPTYIDSHGASPISKQKSYHSLFPSSSLAHLPQVKENNIGFSQQQGNRNRANSHFIDRTESTLGSGSSTVTSPSHRLPPRRGSVPNNRKSVISEETVVPHTHGKLAAPYVPIFSSGLDELEPAVMVEAGTGKKIFKTVMVSAEQLAILNANKNLMNELHIVSQELVESVAREARLEQQLLLKNKSDDSRYLSLQDFEIELRKKSAKIVELIQGLNDERLKRFIAEEQVLLSENGVRPSNLELVYKIDQLEKKLQQRDNEIASLKESLAIR